MINDHTAYFILSEIQAGRGPIPYALGEIMFQMVTDLIGLGFLDPVATFPYHVTQAGLDFLQDYQSNHPQPEPKQHAVFNYKDRT